MSRVDVVVIGAGAMGSATAWWLARRGRSVALVEQYPPLHQRGSSHGGARIFRFAYDVADYARLAMEALPLWRELEIESGRTLLELTGGVDHGPRHLVEPIARTLDTVGAQSELLTSDQARSRFPGMEFDEAVVYSPDGGRVLADLTVQSLHECVARRGGEVFFDTGRAVLELRDSHVLVNTPSGRSWRSEYAVVTAGAWVREVLGHDPSYGLPPLVVSQEQVCHFRPGDGGREWPSFIHHGLTDANSAVYGLRTPGEGVKVGGHHEGRTVTADGRDFALDQRRIDDAVRYAKKWLPGVDPTPIFGATCLYTSTPTNDFILDRVGPVVVGSPCSGHGFKFTPVIGRRLADLAMGAPRPGGRFALAR